MVDAPGVDLATAIAINREALRQVLTDLRTQDNAQDQRELLLLAGDLRRSIILGAVRWLEANGRDFEERRNASDTCRTLLDIASRGFTPRVGVDAPIDQIARDTVEAVSRGLTAEHGIPIARHLARDMHVPQQFDTRPTPETDMHLSTRIPSSDTQSQDDANGENSRAPLQNL